ncbi:uncharacterized protein LOC119349890 [Triticum dicoccoides]|uniref:uncharacterized protein LOC119349890 n=1 Tax=Triticum dicoccoides TaxID=85692 RepID=UPI00188E5D09|nr:uncharacterized protein LOC119349890 [Triticum dicoccoides]
MEVATVFLETSLGTRLAVSFPASATTVADLKRRVSDEHAAAFPHIGHIAVQAIKVNQGGSLYQLTDSMAVRDAFQGVTGAWHLQLQLDALHVDAHQQAPPQVPHACNCKHDSSSSRSFAAALGCQILTHQHQQAQLEATHTETERPPRDKHRAVKRPAADSDFDFGLLSVHKEPRGSIIAGNMCNAANSKQDAPCVEELDQADPCSQMQVEEKETWTPKEADSSQQQEAMQNNVEEKESLTAKLCNGDESSNKETDHPPPPCAAVSTKEGENEAMRCKVDENGPLTAKAVRIDERNDNRMHQSTKKGDSYEKEAMTRQVEEKEPLAANVCNGDESSNKETHHPSPCAAEATKEGDSYEKEEAIKHKAEEKVCNNESSSNWTDPSPGDGSMNEADSSENEVMQHEAEEKEPWTDSVCKGGGSSHWNDPIEWTDAEQRAWEMALKKRRRPRTTVRKMPNSRAAKLYGYS